MYNDCTYRTFVKKTTTYKIRYYCRRGIFISASHDFESKTLSIQTNTHIECAIVCAFICWMAHMNPLGVSPLDLRGFSAVSYTQCTYSRTDQQQCFFYMSSIKTKYNIRTVTYDGSTLILIQSFLCAIQFKDFQSESQCLPNLHIFHIHFQKEEFLANVSMRVCEIKKTNEILSHYVIAKFILWID